MGRLKSIHGLASAFAMTVCFVASAQDDPSQRLLPLPQSNSPNMAQHMELLKRLRSLMDSQQSQKPQTAPKTEEQSSPADPARSGSSPSPASPDAPLPPDQLQRFQDALKNLADKLPPGFVPPNLGDVPPDQLKKTMENPAVQQQMRDMLKQFSQDGVIPPAEKDGRAPLPLPPKNDPSPIRPNETPDNAETGNDRPSPTKENPNESSTKTPPPGSLNALKDFLNRLADESNSSPEKTPSAKPNAGKPPIEKPGAVSPESSTEPLVDSTQGSKPAPRQLLRRRDRKRKSNTEPAPENAASEIQPEPASPQQSSPPAPTDSSLGNPMPADPKPVPQPASPNTPKPDSGTINSKPSPVPANPPGNSATPDSEPNLPGQSTNPADQLRQLQELQKALEQLRDSAQLQPQRNSEPQRNADSSRPGMVAPPTLIPPPTGSPNNRVGSEAEAGSNEALPDGRKNSPATGNRPTTPPEISSQRPEIPEFLKQQLKDLNFPPAPAGPASPARPGDSPLNRSPSKSNDTLPGQAPENEPRQNTSPPAINPRDEVKDSVKQELNRKGFGETIKGIVERATKESRQPKPAPSSNNTGDQNATPGNGSQSGALSDSMMRTLDGLKDELAEIAKDARFKPSPADRNNRRSQQTEPAGNSTLDQLRNAASEFLAAPPDPQPRTLPSLSELSSSASSSSFDSQFDLTPVLVLVGILAAAAIGFFGMRHWKLGGTLSPGLLMPAGAVHPSEIRSRDDLVRAFHAFSLRSAHRVQTWWTHRDVQRLVAESAPEKKAAVELLANAYEQARYLPHDRELSSEEIMLAREALLQCSAAQRSI